MKLNGENIIQAPRMQVWEALNSSDVLKETIPGAQSVEQTSADEFEATVEIKIGPVKAPRAPSISKFLSVPVISGIINLIS